MRRDNIERDGKWSRVAPAKLMRWASQGQAAAQSLARWYYQYAARIAKYRTGSFVWSESLNAIGCRSPCCRKVLAATFGLVFQQHSSVAGSGLVDRSHPSARSALGEHESREKEELGGHARGLHPGHAPSIKNTDMGPPLQWCGAQPADGCWKTTSASQPAAVLR